MYGHGTLLMLQGEAGAVVSSEGLPGRKGEPGIPGIPVRNKAECFITLAMPQ